MSQPTISAYPVIAQAPADPWRAAVQQRFHCSPEWLAMLEANNFGLDRRYSLLTGATAADSGGGGLCTYLVDAEIHPRFQPLGLLTHDELVRPALERLPAEDRPAYRVAVDQLVEAAIDRAAVSVAPFGYQSALVAADPQHIPPLIDELERVGDEWDCPTSAVLYVDWRSTDLRAALEGRGYIGWVSGANAELPVEWPSVEQYVATRTTQRRSKIRREMTRFAHSGITVRRSLLPADTSELARLAALHQHKHGHGFHPEFEEMVLQNFRKFLGDDCFIVAGYRDGQPVGFVVALRDRDIWRVGVSGWDESRSVLDEHAYFNLGYYELIRYAIEDGVSVLSYGLEAYEAKLNRGCRLEPLWSYVRVPEQHRALVTAVANGQNRAARDQLAGRTPSPAWETVLPVPSDYVRVS